MRVFRVEVSDMPPWASNLIQMFVRQGGELEAQGLQVMVQSLWFQVQRCNIDPANNIQIVGLGNFECRCRANMAHMRQSRPDSGLGR